MSFKKVFYLVVILMLVSTSSALADRDLYITVTKAHVTDDTDGPLNDPDPYIKIYVYPSQSGKSIPARSVVIWGQEECTHPHKNRIFRFLHVEEPFNVVCYVYDEDGKKDFLMASVTGKKLSDGSKISTIGKAFDIELEMKTYKSKCGKNQTTALRNLPENANPSQTIPVTLALHIDTGVVPQSLTLYEQLPTGFVFVDANPTPTSITHQTDSDGLDVTFLTWEFSQPSFEETSISYNVITPALAEQLTQSFGTQIIQDDSVIYCGLAGNDIRIGVEHDCNQNGIEDVLDILNDPSIDVNGNGLIDECEEYPVKDQIIFSQGLTFTWYQNGLVTDERWCYNYRIPYYTNTIWDAHAGTLDFREKHPEYNGMPVVFAFYRPAGANGFRQTIFGVDHSVSDVYVINLGDLDGLGEWRIPDVALAGPGCENDTVFTVVDLGTYGAANPLGFVDGSWNVGQTLSEHGIEIIQGQVAGVQGVLWAADEFNSVQPFAKAQQSLPGSDHLLNSNEYPCELVIVAEHTGGMIGETGDCDCGVWGDVNGDGAINPVDVVHVVSLVYLGRELPIQLTNCPRMAGDVNCDGDVNPIDVVYYVNQVYLGTNMFYPDPCTTQ